jgi:16S rRNA (adenine1518-N6/adenine1519-N6)-dimethyltransferase
VKRRNARALLLEQGLVPKKSFGQNFLTAAPVLERIAAACVRDAEIGTARVLEMGAGLGALTAALVARAARVTAVERDRDLVPLLRAAFAEEIDQGRVAVLEADAQTLDVGALLGEPQAGAPRILCGNLPYQITGRLLALATASRLAFERAVFMVQDEVARRLLAAPGTKDYGALTVFVRAAFDVARVAKVSPQSFYPSPDVTSAVVELSPLDPPRAHETEAFRTIVKAAFGMRRKTLRNAWRGVFRDAAALERAAGEAGIDLDRRGETLEVGDYARIAKHLEAH